MKFIPTLFLSVLLTVTVGLLLKIPQKQAARVLVSPLVAGLKTSDSSNPNTETEISQISWPIFVNNLSKYKIRHPSEVIIKNKRNGDISLSKDPSISIDISQKMLGENKTISTTIEADIDQKKLQHKDKFILEGIISPIALGQVTAFTYTAYEDGNINTYYYVPQENGRYLLILNQSVRGSNSDYLTAENIIYSLELLP